MFIVSSCDSIGKSCLYEGNEETTFVETEQSFDLPANSATWVNSGMNIVANTLFQIKVDGNVNMCTFDKNIYMNADVGSNKIFQEFTDGSYLDFGGYGVMVIQVEGDYNTSGPTNAWVSTSTSSSKICTNGDNMSSGCFATKGFGLYTFKGSELLFDNSSSKFPQFSSYIPNSENSYITFDSDSTISSTKVYSPVSNRGLVFIEPDSGRLGFSFTQCKYGKTCSSDVFQNSSGNYTLNVRRFAPECEITNGESYNIGDGINLGGVEYVVSNTVPSDDTKGFYASGKNNRLEAVNDGTIYFRVVDRDGEYGDNTGSYRVKITKYSVKTTQVGRFLSRAVTPVKERVSLASRVIYEGIAKNSSFSSVLKSMLILYIAIYGIYYLAGLVQISQNDLLVRVAKVAAISILFTQTSWDFFNQYLFVFFIDGIEELIYKVMGTASDNESGIFSFVDIFINQVFSTQVWLKISIFLVLSQMPTISGIATAMGIASIILIGYGLWTYFFVVLEMFVGYLFVVERTKSYFDGWIKYLFNYTLQPLILFLSVAVLNEMISFSFWKMFSFNACWGCVGPITISLPSFSLGGFDVDLKLDIACIPWYKLSFGSVTELLPGMLIFCMFVGALKGMLTLAPAIADVITGTMYGGGTDTTGDRSIADHLINGEEGRDGLKHGGVRERIKSLIGQDEVSVASRKQETANAITRERLSNRYTGRIAEYRNAALNFKTQNASQRVETAKNRHDAKNNSTETKKSSITPPRSTPPKSGGNA
jgi:type IV secretion system protein VirB6